MRTGGVREISRGAPLDWRGENVAARGEQSALAFGTQVVRFNIADG